VELCETFSLSNLQDQQKFPKSHPLQITFRYPLTPHTILTWDTTLLNDNLYIEVPNGCLPDASKEAFVALLEYAEEVLQCRHAVVCFKADRMDRGEENILSQTCFCISSLK